MRKKIIIVISIILVLVFGFLLLNFDFKNNEIKSYTTTTSTTNITTITKENTTKPTTTSTKEKSTTTKKKITSKKTTSITTNKKTSTTTKTTNTTNKTTIVSLELVDTKTIEEVINTKTKYGVVIKTIKTTKYNIYSDGSKKEQSSKIKTTYDRSGFNATTINMKDEATSLVENNMATLNSVLNYVNTYRSEVGKTNLVLDKNLSIAATIRALEIAWADKFSHTRPNGESCFTVLSDLKISIRSAGENIALGYSNAKSVSEGWKNSQGHYENMINNDFNKIGIGVVTHNNTKYWVQLFSN